MLTRESHRLNGDECELLWDEPGSGAGTVIVYTHGDEDAAVKDLDDIFQRHVYISPTTLETFIKDVSTPNGRCYSFDDEPVAYRRASVSSAVGASAASFTFDVFVFRTSSCIVCHVPFSEKSFGLPCACEPAVPHTRAS